MKPAQPQPLQATGVSPTGGIAGVSDADLLSLLNTLKRGRWTILGTMAALVALGWVYVTQVAVPKYQAAASVALESRNRQVVDLGNVVSDLSGNIFTINTEAEVLRSQRLVGKLVDQLALVDDPEFNPGLAPRGTPLLYRLPLAETLFGPPAPAPVLNPAETRTAVIDRVLGMVRIENAKYSYVFTITIETTDPVKSALIANTLAELYILDQLEVKFQATEQATSWLTERVSTLKVELEAAEAAVKDHNTSTDLVSPEALAQLNSQLKGFRGRLGDLRETAATQADRVAVLEAAGAAGDPAGMMRAAADPALTRLAPADAAAPRTAFDARFAQVLGRARFDLERTNERIAAIETSAAELEGRIQAQSADLIRLQQLEREAEASRLIYEYFLGRLKETSVQQGIQQADARILSDATPARVPSSPQSMLILGVSALLGLLVGTGLVLLRELRRTGFRSAEELEAATGIVTLGRVVRVPSLRRRNVIRRLATNPNSEMSEAVRNLRTSIFMANMGEPPQVIMTTSSIPDEGKTTLVLALAENIARMGKRVLLIEGDIRRRTFQKYFDEPDARGLLSVASGELALESAVYHSDLLGADILMGERTKLNAADFFSSYRFRDVIAEARAQYEVVLIDTPPVLVVPDARLIGKHADSIVYVVHWDKTPRTLVMQGLHAFKTVNLNVSGLVLNQIDARRMRSYTSYYGGYYTRRAKGYYDADTP